MSVTISKSSLALVAALAVAALGSGCTVKPEQKTGNLKISVSSSSLQISDIKRVDVLITGGTPSIGTPISATLTVAPNGKQWTGNLTGIPAATGINFQATAYGDLAATTVLYQGSTTGTVVAGATATVVIILQEKNPNPGPSNYAPVVTAVTSTSSQVIPGTVVGIGFSAQDPDGNYALTYQWTSSCTGAAGSGTFATAAGSLGTGATAAGTVLSASTFWTAPSLATYAGVCTLGIQVTDNNLVQGKSSVQTFFTISVSNTNGTVAVVAFPNSFPVISVFRGDIAYNYDASAVTPVGGVGQKGNLFATALDPDGDNLRYNFQVKCSAPVAGVPTLPASIAVGADLTSQLSFTTLTGASGTAANPTWSLSDPSQSCIFAASVRDLCTAGNCGAALTGTVTGAQADGTDRGGLTVGYLNFTAPVKPTKAPYVIRTSAPNTSGPSGATVINPSTAYAFNVEASDPEAGNLTVTWTPSTGTISAPVVTGNAKSVVTYTSPASLLASMSLTAAIKSDKSNLTTTVTFVLVASDPCVGQANGTACTTGNLCVTGESCTAGVCGSGAAVTCGGDQCNTGVCNPNSGCGTTPKATGTSCTDSNACTGTAASPDACSAPVAGVSSCTPGAQVPAPVAGLCSQQYTTADCNPVTGYPAAAPTPGVACSDGNGCTTGDVCGAAVGVCAGTAVTCSQSANTCQAAAGTCVADSATTNHCTFANLANGTSCSDANSCTAGDVCTAGLCAGTSSCPAGSSCNGSGAVCAVTDTKVVPQVATSVQLNNFQGVAMATDGSSFVTGNLGGTKSFGGTPLTSAGANDIFVGKYSSSGAVVFAKAFGDASDQAATGIAVTSSSVVAIGQFSGAFNGLNDGQAYAIDYVLFLDPTTGAVTAARQYDLGLGGNFTAVGANPALGLVAVCGQTVQAATTLVPGATFGGATDVVIAVFNAAGTLQWSKQVGGTNGEACTAITVDNVGNVVAAGKYDGSGATVLGFTGTALPAPGSSFRKHIWVAEFNGTTGAALVQKSFGSGGGSHQPNSIAVDPSNNYVVAGLFSASLPFGAFTVGTACTAAQPGCLVSAGGSDAFVAKLDPTTLVPAFATRIGAGSSDEGRGVAVDSFGNITVVGLINGAATAATVTPTTTATAAVAAVSAPSVNASAFLAKLPGSTGVFNAATAAAYGNATNTVNANKVSINGQGTGAVKDLVVFGGEYNGTLNFGALAGSINTTTGGNEDFLVFGKLQ